jgi:hypothetical protein
MRKRNWYEYVGVTILMVLVVLILHVVAHVLAWVSMWKYAAYLICGQLGVQFGLLVSEGKYVRVEHFVGIIGSFVWLFMDYIHVPQKQYYSLMWVLFALVILRILAQKSNHILT